MTNLKKWGLMLTMVGMGFAMVSCGKSKEDQLKEKQESLKDRMRKDYDNAFDAVSRDCNSFDSVKVAFEEKYAGFQINERDGAVGGPHDLRVTYWDVDPADPKKRKEFRLFNKRTPGCQ